MHSSSVCPSSPHPPTLIFVVMITQKYFMALLSCEFIWYIPVVLMYTSIHKSKLWIFCIKNNYALFMSDPNSDPLGRKQGWCEVVDFRLQDYIYDCRSLLSYESAENWLGNCLHFCLQYLWTEVCLQDVCAQNGVKLITHKQNVRSSQVCSHHRFYCTVNRLI